MANNDAATSPFMVVPSAMLIGLRSDQEDECATVLAPLHIKILRVAHLVAACERMVTLRPLVLVIAEEQPAEAALGKLREIADAISAQIVVHRDGLDPARRKLEILAALRAAGVSRDT